MIGRQLDILRVRAVFVRAEVAVVVCAAIVMTRHALLASLARQDPPAGHPRVPIGRSVGRIRSERDQLAAEIAAEDVGKSSLVRLVASGPRHQVIAVEADGVHLDEGFAALRPGCGKIGVCQHVRIA